MIQSDSCFHSFSILFLLHSECKSHSRHDELPNSGVLIFPSVIFINAMTAFNQWKSVSNYFLVLFLFRFDFSTLESGVAYKWRSRKWEVQETSVSWIMVSGEAAIQIIYILLIIILFVKQTAFFFILNAIMKNNFKG